MPILDNSFTCTNGHSFTANAKVRARCPQCGALTRRDFTVFTPKEPKEPKTTEARKEPLLVREGRPRIVSPKGPTKGVPRSTDKQVTLKKSVTTKKATTRKPVKSLAKPLGKTASGIVKVSRIATKGQSPQVTRKPKRTAIARHIRVPQKESFMDSVVRRFGPG